MIPDKCVTTTNTSNIKVSDLRSQSAVFSNPSKSTFSLVRFDGCVVSGSTACDWIVEKQGVGRIAVELKGADVEHAAEQIECALQFLKAEGLTDLSVAGLIICSRYPSIDTKIQRIKQRIAKSFRAPLKVKTDGRSLSFEAILSF